jgi:hypothetical protein
MMVSQPYRLQKLSTVTWKKLGILSGLVGVFALALWGTATVFDASELKALSYIAMGSAAREFGPLVWQIVKYLLHDTTEAFARGGHVE